jgi:citrate lyase beta subunit
LILPVTIPRFVEKAYASGADAIVLDLERARGLTP